MLVLSVAEPAWIYGGLELERYGTKCSRACDAFCVVVKRSANPSTAGPKRPVEETGESKKAVLSASLFSIKFNHKWSSSTARLAMALPIRSVVLRRSQNASGSGPDSSIERRSLAWNTWRTAIMGGRSLPGQRSSCGA